MELKPVTVDLEAYPTQLRPLLDGTKVFDSSCSPEARVLFVNKDGGYFLKHAAAENLARECAMARYFWAKGLGARVVEYLVDQEGAWLLTEKVAGDDCVAAKYLDQPERLCDTLAEVLAGLHAHNFESCPVPDHTERYLSVVERNHRAGRFDATLFPDNWRYRTAEEAHCVVQAKSHLLQSDTLVHGDYCLPNVILDGWKLSGFVDVGNGGVGDRHIDLFWGAWTLAYNLKTDAYRQRFFDAYGRDKVDEERLRLVAACEVFG